MHLPACILQAWEHTSTDASASIVLPDGCRDLILLHTPGRAPQWLVTALADAAYRVPSVAGTRYWGWRFQPGALLTEGRLLCAIRQGKVKSINDSLGWVSTLVQINPQVSEALSCLAHSADVASAARSLGVSERSLQRWLGRATGRNPGYWRALARARRAAAALPGATPLIEIAADHGFADQAHMSREFRRWFDTTPSAARASPALLANLTLSGYA